MTIVNAIATVPRISDSYSYVTNFYGCGQDNYDDRAVRGNRDNDAYVFRIEENGELGFNMKIAGKRPNRRSQASDICTGIQYDART